MSTKKKKKPLTKKEHIQAKKIVQLVQLARSIQAREADRKRTK